MHQRIFVRFNAVAERVRFSVVMVVILVRSRLTLSGRILLGKVEQFWRIKRFFRGVMGRLSK